MKVITLHQPWATLIALGVKTIETRSWPTNVRGRVAIHAAARPPTRVICPEMICENDTTGVWFYRAPHGEPAEVPLGVIVATANLVDVAYMCDLDGTGMPDEGGSPALYLYPDGRLIISHHFETPVRTFDVTDQRPYGDFAPGRFAWLLDDIEPLAMPMPFRGGQGFSRSWEPNAPNADQ